MRVETRLRRTEKGYPRRVNRDEAKVPEGPLDAETMSPGEGEGAEDKARVAHRTGPGAAAGPTLVPINVAAADACVSR